jgi:hypothetical protein
MATSEGSVVSGVSLQVGYEFAGIALKKTASIVAFRVAGFGMYLGRT